MLNLYLYAFFEFKGWHRGMKRQFQECGENIYKFIGVLYGEARLKLQLIYQLGRGIEIPDPDPVTRRRNAEICRVVQQYGERDKIDFLRGISHGVRLG